MTRTKSPLMRLRELMQADRGDVVAVAVFAVVAGGFLLATPVAVQALVDFVAFGASVPSIGILAALLFLGLSAAAGVTAIQTWIVEILQRRTFVRIVADLTDRLPKIAWWQRDRTYQPELVNRFFDVVTIQKTGAMLILDGIANLLTIGVGLTVLAFYHPLLLAFDVGLVVAILMVFFFPFRAGLRSAIAESSAKYEVASWLEEIARHPLAMKATGADEYVDRRSLLATSNYVSARRGHYRVVFVQLLATLGLQAIANTALLGLGGWLVVKGELTLGQLVAAELLVVLVVQGVAKLGRLAEKVYDLLAAVEKVGMLLDLETETVGGSREEFGQEPASLEVKDIRLVGRGLNLRRAPISFAVNPGEVVGVVGPHGSGKTLLAESIYRLRDPEEGHILVNGSHTADFTLQCLRSGVALVSGVELFDATIFENVALGRSGIDHETVEEALDVVGLSDDFRHLREGLATKLLANGSPLSSGQCRRLMIARAIVGAPQLIILDGSLDGLSPEGLSAVKKGVLDHRERWTTLVLTDDAEVRAYCDRVVDLSIKETGEGPARS